MREVENLNERLKRLRKKAGLSQTELGTAVGVALQTVFRWEAGERSPRAEEIRRIAAALHVTEAELLNGPEETEIRITLHYSEMPKEVEINMDGKDFDLYMPGNGSLGINGAAKFSSLEDIDKFLERARSLLVQGFAFQQSRGAIPATA